LNSKKAKIFCVHDVPANLKLLKMSLSKYDCLLFESGEACLEHLEAEKPDMILLDVMMPGLDGIETCKQIRKCCKDTFLPVIFVSAKDSIDDRLKGYAAGGDDYICKPFDQAELHAKVQALLKVKAEMDETLMKAMDSETLLHDIQETSNVVNFLQNVLPLRHIDSVANLTLETLKAMGLSCGIQIRFENQTQQYFSEVNNPLENSIFDFIKSKGRIVGFGEKLAINYPNISLIVRNIPKDDANLVGRLRDHLALILKGADAKINALEKEAETLQKYSMLTDFMSELKDILSKLDDSYQKHKKFSETILAKLADDLEDAFMHMGLTELQELELKKIVEEAETTIHRENDDFAAVHRQFSTMNRQIDTVIDHSINSLNTSEDDNLDNEMIVLFD